MAKHKRRGRKFNSKFQVIPVNATIALGTLASETALLQNLTILQDDFWAQSADLIWAIHDLTPGQDPIAVGLANGDLSVAEVKEALNASPVSRSDIVARERARRPIRKVGQFSSQDASSSSNRLNDGKAIRTTVKMYMAEGTELNAFAFNQSGAALTTGAIVRVWGDIYGEWR